MQESATTFEAVAREWLALKDWEAVTKARRLDMLEACGVSRRSAHFRSSKLPRRIFWTCCNTAAKKNGLTVAAEAQRTMSGVFELAVSTLRAEVDPVYPVRKAMPANKTQHKRPLEALTKSGSYCAILRDTADGMKP